MAGIFRTPLRVYLALAVLSFIGIWSAFQLPISLFPNSSKPSVTLSIGYDLAPDAFLKTYGESIEEQIRNIRRGPLEVEKVISEYKANRVYYNVDFKWGSGDDEALREMETLRSSVLGRLPPESRNRVWVWSQRENGGFLALSFFSNERSLSEIYKILEPALMPKLALVKDAAEPELYNPQRRQVLIELKPEVMATMQLFPSHVGAAVLSAIESYSGGSLTINGSNMTVEYPRFAASLEHFRQIQIPTANGHSVALSDVAHLDLTIPLDATRITKTSGAASVILFASPKPGGNIKAMSEEILHIVEEAMPSLPKDIQYKNLVDPSAFIRAAVSNVAKEVGLAAGLAVFILFMFVGNIKNVITAAIEITLSLVLAVILMRMTGMNLNLISLGGLALSAGMNVDASVVVMENIFRHFEELGHERAAKLTFEERLAVIVRAVKEVQFSVIASTIASLVVFLPLAFTSELSNAILGDLAKAVVFSHGFSAVVALVLVPTIRLHVMRAGVLHEKPSLLDAPLRRLEDAYASALGVFLERPSLRLAVMGGLGVVFVLLMALVLPNLPREVIGKPDTDSVFLSIGTSGNTLVRQMEAQTDQIENDIMRAFGDKVSYTFTQIPRANSSWILLRLKNKRDMDSVLKGLEEKFPNTPLTNFYAEAWNPAEMKLPDPPDFKISIRGNHREAMNDTARDIEIAMLEKKIFTRTHVEPGTQREDTLRIRPKTEQLVFLGPLMASQGARLSLASFSELTRTATDGQVLTKVEIDGETMDAFIRFPMSYVSTTEELGALPVGVGGRILPLKALATFTVERAAPAIRRENGREAYIIYARGGKDEELKTKESVRKATELIQGWPKVKADQQAVAGTIAPPTQAAPSVQIEDAKVELNDALKQLAVAVSLSIALIFLTMVFQFGSIMNSLLVLVAVPLGFIGVLTSLFVFQSSLSLNSLLGVILLNGLAVANSIILVDFLQRKVREGVAPRRAALEVARVRLRPILMTSLTTGLGMLPIAMGFGEGGKILQPLGIAVAGGLSFSMVTTLFIVPALQVSWLEWSAARKARCVELASTGATTALPMVLAIFLSGAFLNEARAEKVSPLAFQSAFRGIVERNLKVAQQKIEVEKSEHRRLQAYGAFVPKVEVDYSQANTVTSLNTSNQTATSSSLLLKGSVNLFRSGGDLAGLRGAEKSLASSQHQLSVERQNAENEAVHFLTAYIARVLERQITERSVEFKQDSLRIAHERFARGLLPMQEVHKVAIDLDNIKAKLSDARGQESVARAGLVSALGHDEVQVVWPWKESLTQAAKLEEAAFRIDTRPDWMSLTESLNAVKFKERQAFGSLLPTVDFSATYGSLDLAQSGRSDWSALLTLSIPLFSGFQDLAGYRLQSAQAQQAVLALEAVRRQAPADVDELRRSFREAREAAQTREKNVKLTEKLYADNLQRFRIGRASANELAYDLDRLLQAQIHEVEGWRTAHMTFVRLCHALGSSVSAEGHCQTL